jgi:hypothetical protein
MENWERGPRRGGRPERKGGFDGLIHGGAARVKVGWRRMWVRSYDGDVEVGDRHF